MTRPFITGPFCLMVPFPGRPHFTVANSCFNKSTIASNYGQFSSLWASWRQPNSFTTSQPPWVCSFFHARRNKTTRRPQWTEGHKPTGKIWQTKLNTEYSFKKKYILCVKDDSSGYHPERVISFSSSRSVSFSQMPNSAARKTKERREEIEVASKSRIIKGGFRQWRRRVGERAQLEKRRRRRSGRGGLLQERGRSGGGRRRKIRIGYKFYCFYSPPFASRPC